MKQLIIRQLNSDINTEINDNTELEDNSDIIGIIDNNTNSLIYEKIVVAIPPYYIQFPDSDGVFDTLEEPSTYFKNNYQIETSWELLFNTESVFFRTEGELSEEGRENGIQPYGMKKLTGNFNSTYENNILQIATGIFYMSGSAKNQPSVYQANGGYVNINIDTSKQIKEYTNDLVVKNRTIRIYKKLKTL